MLLTKVMSKCWVNIEQFKATQHKIRYWRTQQLFGLKGSLKTFCISLTIFQFNKVKRFSWCDTFNNLLLHHFLKFYAVLLFVGKLCNIEVHCFYILINLHTSWFPQTIQVCITKLSTSNASNFETIFAENLNVT